MSLGNLQVGVDCEQCGKTAGVPMSNGQQRCFTCGRFAQEAEQYCLTHDVDYSNIYPNDPHCPMCREERRVQDMRMHQMTRDPMVEPW